MRDIAAYLDARLVPEPNSGCLIWTGMISVKGYGRIIVDGRYIGAHRVAFELANGPLPQGMVPDHKCKVRCCINPRHMRALTHVENVMCGDGPTAIRARATSCLNGHPLTGDNLYIRPSSGYRSCRACKNARQQRARHAIRSTRIQEGEPK